MRIGFFRTRPLLAVLLAGALAGCGGGSTAGTPSVSESSSDAGATADADMLTGDTYTSTEVTGHTLAPETAIKLTFSEGLSVNAGCNTQFGAYQIKDDTLAWTGPAASTMMACEPSLMKQDTWLSGLFTEGVQISVQQPGELVLTHGDVTIRLKAASAAQLTEVLGKTWTLEAIAKSDTVSSVPVNVRTPTLTVGADGSASLDTGCNTGRTTVTVDGDALAFEQGPLTMMACEPPASDVETAVLAVLNGPADSATWDGSVLTITKGAQSLTFQVA